MTDDLDAVLARMEQQEMDEPTLPAGCTAKEALQMELRGEVKLTPSQFRAAKELLPYENPKLTAVAIGHMDQSSFAAALERAIERSKGSPPVSSTRVNPGELPSGRCFSVSTRSMISPTDIFLPP